ncbi:MAG: hypothetical protein JNK05_29270 [Myxococcales bacterium]|nr:hypothetical protein [Myxococcales bacterium]
MRSTLFALLALGCAALFACSDGPSLAPSDARGSGDASSMDSSSSMDVPSFDSMVADDSAAADAAADSGSSSDASVEDSSEAGCTSTVAMPPYSDRTMNEEFTDPPTCAGCPSPYADVDELSIATLPDGATSLRVAGSARGATQCEWFVSNSSCGHTGGRILTDPEGGGLFSTTLPVFCGTNVVRIVCRNERGARVLVRRIEGPRCSGRDLRVTLAWDMAGRDLELHLLRAPRALNSMTDDCTWFTCMSPAGLEWGAAGDTDNPRKDIDNTGSFGPENIYLDRAPAGTYYVMVEHWSRSGEPSTADVDIIVRERSVARLRRTMFPRQWVWNVGTITFPEGRFTPNDTTVDCNASWMATSRGCDLPLP